MPRIGRVNPVRAKLVREPEDWQWSSARAHMTGQDDELVKVNPLLELVGGKWKEFITADSQQANHNMIRKHERSGRPLGDEAFIIKMERFLGRMLKPQRAGRRPKVKENGN